MTKAESIAEMFGNDGQCYLACGKYLSETRTLDELCDLTCVRKERGRVSYKGDGCTPNYEYSDSGDLTRYEFSDGSAIVDSGVAWDIEGETKFSWQSE